MPKYIFITGGVVSSLGKGLTSAAIGMLLESKGLKINIQKFDPYLNVDPGTMSPFQHGEVYVTEDGAETDLDLGHYERFTNAKLTHDCNFTSGIIYNSVITKERRGDFLGSTVQVIPHITDEIKLAVKKLATPDVDVVITEVGGTVGDIESLPFLEAIRQFGFDIGRENTLYIHLTLVPYLPAAQEMKTKPTQQSVGKLREIGLQPDVLICRTQKKLTEEAREKIALFCNVSKDAVFEEKDVDYSIYEIPVVLHDQKLDEFIVKKLGLPNRKPKISRWKKILKTIKDPSKLVDIAVVGKYIRLQDAYKSIYEALTHGGIANDACIRIHRIEAEEIENSSARKCLKNVDGVLVPGGFGMRGIKGKSQVIRYAREKKMPFFGICLGMQCATIEFARNVCGLKGANSTEFDPKTKHPVICLMEEQKKIIGMGHTMRLGAYPCVLREKTLARSAYGKKTIHERHRHRYEFNNSYRELFEDKGMIMSGVSPEGALVEIIELKGHPWFVAVQFHPEFKSKPTAPHPLFAAFVKASLSYRRKKRK